MLMHLCHWRGWCLAAAVVLAAVAGCPEKEEPATEATEETTAGVLEAEEAVPEAAKLEEVATVGAKAEEVAEEAGEEAVEEAGAEVEAKLAAADAFDGTVDKIVSKCPSCALAMDGLAEHTLEVAGYKLRFCSAHCRESFAKDTTKAILALNIPEE